jgi:menaquinone-dependent protoporphyrinogen oxidase
MQEWFMGTKILVAFASKYGATAEIAEKIGGVLSEAGLVTDVVPVVPVEDVSQYSAVILGSAVYVGKWRKEAVKFLKTNEKLLSDRPVWLFSSGPSGEGDPVQLLDGWIYPTALQTSIEIISPREIKVFHGSVNPEQLNFIEKSMINTVKAPVGDFRDWDQIKSWAATIVDILEDEGLFPG